MRPLVLALLVSLTALAGCIADDPLDPDGSNGASSDTVDEATRDQRRAEILAKLPEFCESKDDCDYWDEMFHEFVVYDLDTSVFDVVIVPPAGASTPDQIAASRQAVQAWRDGILHFASPWLQEAFEINVYAVGIDIPSIDAIEDPEIIVISTSAAGIFGIGLEPIQLSCLLIGEITVADLGGHEHEGNQIKAENCAGTGFTCFALNVGGLNAIDLYDLIAHEVGHCLGAGHVGDALDFRSRYAPIEDIMSYQSNATHVHCVSNMNVRVLEGVYGHLHDQPEETWLGYGDYYEMDPVDYELYDCENPPGA